MSNGLYLSQILSMRDELSFDPNYGSFVTSLNPINIIIIPFVPFGMFMKPNKKFNDYVMKS